MRALSTRSLGLKQLGLVIAIGIGLILVATNILLPPCDGRILMPSVEFGSHYVIIDNSHRLSWGQSYVKTHEGIWFEEFRVIFLASDIAVFRVHYQNTDEVSYRCTAYLGRSASVASNPILSFTTQDPEGLRPLLFQPTDLGGHWVAETYRIKITYLPIQQPSQRPFVDQIRASIAAIPVPASDLDLPDYVPPHSALQSIYVYADEAKALAAFRNDNQVFEEVPISNGYQPLLENHLARCIRTDAFRCTFWGQYGHYVVYLTLEMSGSVTWDDWAEIIKVVQERLIKQVEQGSTALP